MPESSRPAISESSLSPEAAAMLAEARRQLAAVGGCALLIGVESYPGLSPDKQLFAGRNDVLSYWRVCRRLGYRARHIRARTSPVLTKEEILRIEVDLALERDPHQTRAEVEANVARRLADAPWGDMLGEATNQGIRDGVAWLAHHLVFTVKLEGEGWSFAKELTSLPGLLAYSGHGAQYDGDLALCPSDVGADLARALTFGELRTLIDAGDEIRAEGTPRPSDNLTVVLDCCFAAGASERSSLRVTSLTPGDARTAAVAKREIGTRVFCASGRDERSSQAVLGGHWHGAFTWAFTRALEQWTSAPSGQFQKSTISHVELLFRARMLLEALSFPQRPVLVDQIGNLPVFQHDSDMDDDTSSEPTAERRTVQMDPGFADFRVYTFTSGGSVVANVLVAKNPGTLDGVSYQVNTEYWHDVSPSGPSDSLNIRWIDYYWALNPTPNLGVRCFTMQREPTWVRQQWSAVPQGFPANPKVFVNGTIALYWNLTKQANIWNGNLQWHQSSSNNSLFDNRGPDQTFRANQIYTGTGSFYRAIVSPQ